MLEKMHQGCSVGRPRVGSNSTVISVLQIYDGCCFHFCLRFKTAHVEQLHVGAIDDAYALGLVDCC